MQEQSSNGPEFPDPAYLESELARLFDGDADLRVAFELARQLGDDADLLSPEVEEDACASCLAMMVARPDLSEKEAIACTAFAVTLTRSGEFSVGDIFETLGLDGLVRDRRRAAGALRGMATDVVELAEKALVEKRGSSVEPDLREKIEEWQQRHYPWAQVYGRTRSGCAPIRPRPSSTPRVRSRARGAGRPAVKGASRRASARSGDSGSDDGEPEPPGEDGRLCDCGCGTSIEPLAPQARYLSDTHRKRHVRAQLKADAERRDEQSAERRLREQPPPDKQRLKRLLADVDRVDRAIRDARGPTVDDLRRLLQLLKQRLPEGFDYEDNVFSGVDPDVYACRREDRQRGHDVARLRKPIEPDGWESTAGADTWAGSIKNARGALVSYPLPTAYGWGEYRPSVTAAELDVLAPNWRLWAERNKLKRPPDVLPIAFPPLPRSLTNEQVAILFALDWDPEPELEAVAA